MMALSFVFSAEPRAERVEIRMITTNVSIKAYSAVVAPFSDDIPEISFLINDFTQTPQSVFLPCSFHEDQ